MTVGTRYPRAVAGAAVLALGLSLTACGGDSGSGDGGRKEFHVLVYGDAGNKVERAIVKEFNKTSDVKAVLDTIPGADYQAKLQTIMSTKQAPDVFFNWGAGSVQPFVKANLLLPLDDMMKKDPGLKSKFLPSVMKTAELDGKSYGVPMRGTQPVVLFNNKKVLAKYDLKPPTTWAQLLTDVKTLKSKGVTPFALGGGDQWPTLMWFEYLYDRVAGPELFTKAVGGDKDAWADPASKKALSMLRDLVDAGAFGTNYDSVKQTNQGTAQLLASGKAAFELMGSWEYSTVKETDPGAVADLGYTNFPSVQGGKGDPANLVGNTNNYYSVTRKAKYPDAIAKFLKLMYTDGFVKQQLAIGNLTTTTNTEKFLDSTDDPAYAKFQLDTVAKAPSFQVSWDQAYTPDNTTPMHRAVQQFVNGSLDADGFIQAMQALKTS